MEHKSEEPRTNVSPSTILEQNPQFSNPGHTAQNTPCLPQQDTKLKGALQEKAA